MFASASTFKVELDECSRILREAGPKSLVILDGEFLLFATVGNLSDVLIRARPRNLNLRWYGHCRCCVTPSCYPFPPLGILRYPLWIPHR